MVLDDVKALINHIRELIFIQNILKEIAATTSLDEKKAILAQYKENKNLQKALKYAYSSNINFGKNVKRDILDLNESNDFDDVYPLWYMLDKLANNNDSKIVQQEFKDYIEFFPDINYLIIGIITKDLNLGISINSINKIMNNLIFISENEEDSNNHKVLNLFCYR